MSEGEPERRLQIAKFLRCNNITYNMIDTEMLPDYFKDTELSHYEPLKHLFKNMKYEQLLQAIKSNYIISYEVGLDKVFLFEAKTFLRLSIFNLLAYKHLVCGKYLPAALVILYYSYFYSISCLLRLAGKAVIHYKELPESLLENNPKLKKTKFQLTRKANTHDYIMEGLTKNEHTFVWDEFSEYFKDLSKKEIGRIFIEDRYQWNYDLFYPSHATEESAIRETIDRCDYNFIDHDLGRDFGQGAAEDLYDKISQYGHEERYAGDLIRTCLRIFVDVAKKSSYKMQYVAYFEGIKNEINLLESNKSTKEEIKNWFAKAIEELK